MEGSESELEEDDLQKKSEEIKPTPSQFSKAKSSPVPLIKGLNRQDTSVINAKFKLAKQISKVQEEQSDAGSSNSSSIDQTSSNQTESGISNSVDLSQLEDEEDARKIA